MKRREERCSTVVQHLVLMLNDVMKDTTEDGMTEDTMA